MKTYSVLGNVSTLIIDSNNVVCTITSEGVYTVISLPINQTPTPGSTPTTTTETETGTGTTTNTVTTN